MSSPRACSTSAPACPAAKKARATAPRIMPGGSPAAWPHVKDIFQSIAAKVEDGTPCCDWVGEDGAGHYVKMVHNGIEYGDMQLIGEAYQLDERRPRHDRRRNARRLCRMEQGRTRFLPDRNHRATSSRSRTRTASRWWTKSSTPPARKAPANGRSSSSQDLGIPITLMAEAVYARCVSALKDERVNAAKKLKGPRADDLRRPRQNSSKTSATRSTPRRLFPTRRATCSCAPRRRNTNGI